MESTASYEDLLKEFECPVCYCYISPPIRQCINLHAICDSCFKKVDNCPVCRQEKNKKRNHVLERLYNFMEIPCQHEGCKHKAKGSRIKAHETTCHHRPSECPLSILQECQWTGPRTQIEEHCRNEHPDGIVLGPEAQLLAQNIRHGPISNKYMTIFYAFDRVFRVYWDMCANTGAVKFSVSYHGSPEESDRFSYRVRFIKSKGTRVARSLYGKCANVTKRSHLSAPGSVVGANYNSIKSFCTSDGDLTFFLRISDNFKGPVYLPITRRKRTNSSVE